MGEDAMKLKNNKYSGGKQFLSTCFWIVFVVLLAALLRQSVQLGKTVGISAEPTIHNGQTTLDETWTYQFHAPKRGDMVVLYAPFRALQMYHLPQGTRFLKRIIGL